MVAKSRGSFLTNGKVQSSGESGQNILSNFQAYDTERMIPSWSVLLEKSTWVLLWHQANERYLVEHPRMPEQTCPRSAETASAKGAVCSWLQCSSRR